MHILGKFLCTAVFIKAQYCDYSDGIMLWQKQKSSLELLLLQSRKESHTRNKLKLLPMNAQVFFGIFIDFVICFCITQITNTLRRKPSQEPHPEPLDLTLQTGYPPNTGHNLTHTHTHTHTCVMCSPQENHRDFVHSSLSDKLKASGMVHIYT